MSILNDLVLEITLIWSEGKDCSSVFKYNYKHINKWLKITGIVIWMHASTDIINSQDTNVTTVKIFWTRRDLLDFGPRNKSVNIYYLWLLFRQVHCHVLTGYKYDVVKCPSYANWKWASNKYLFCAVYIVVCKCI